MTPQKLVLGVKFLKAFPVALEAGAWNAAIHYVRIDSPCPFAAFALTGLSAGGCFAHSGGGGGWLDYFSKHFHDLVMGNWHGNKDMGDCRLLVHPVSARQFVFAKNPVFQDWRDSFCSDVHGVVWLVVGVGGGGGWC